MPGDKRNRGPRITISLTAQEYKDVWQLADKHDVSGAWIIRRAIEHYMGRKPKGGAVSIEQDKINVEHKARQPRHRHVRHY